MEPLKETVSVRADRINNQILGNTSAKCLGSNIVSKEGLLDALQLLYDECDTDYLKKSDRNVLAFVTKYRNAIQNTKQLRVNLTDFEIKEVIGRGHFGEVHVVKEKQTGDVYAMKTIKKCDSIGQKRTSYEEERNIMVLSRSPWLTHLQYAFQDDSCLFYVMEFHPGGDLVGLLCRQGGSIPESAASFYIAELVVALHDLHQMGFVHRDVKPDNILLDRCGHIKLADFGSAAKLDANGRVNDGLPVGTPDYVAPEVLQALDSKWQKKGASYGVSCDFWSVGVLAYELTIGSVPFTGANTPAVYAKIMKHFDYLTFPPDVLLSQAYVSLIKALVTDQKSRLTHKKIISHPLFKNLDFNGLREVVPPFVPKITNPDDTSNFSDVPPKKNEPNIFDYKRRTQFSGRNLPFVGFTYTYTNDSRTNDYNKMVVKDETLQNLKDELNSLKRKMLKSESLSEMRDALERKLDEKCFKLESVEQVRNTLERDLAKNMSEMLVLKRTLDMERKDRLEVEQKALDMIKTAKQKWESAEKTKVAAIALELDQHKEKIAQLTSTNEILKTQLQHSLQLENKHKAASQNMEKLSRRSVIGLESRLEKVTVETQSQLSDLRLKLSQEMHLKNTLENQLSSYKKNKSSLTSKLQTNEDELRKQKEKLDEALRLIDEKNEKIKELTTCKMKLEEQRLANETTISDLKNALKQERGETSALQKQTEALQRQIVDKSALNSSEAERRSLEKRLRELKEGHAKEVDALRAQVREVAEKRDALVAQLEGAKLREESNLSKVKALEELMMRLENGVAKLENGGEREAVLQEQVERLEQQLVQVHEASAVEKQEFTRLKTKFWRLEKDLENSLIDKRILQRELKDLEKTADDLRSQLDQRLHEMSESKRLHENALVELANLNENIATEVTKLRDTVRNYEERLSMETEKWRAEKSVVAGLKSQVADKEATIGRLARDVEEADKRCEGVCDELGARLRELEAAKASADEAKRETLVLRSELESCRKETENTQLNLNALREACTILENQLLEYERLTDDLEKKNAATNLRMEQLVHDLGHKVAETQDARRQLNEERSLRLLAETRARRLAEDVQCLQKECEDYKGRCGEERRRADGLADELGEAERKIADLEVSLRGCERRSEELESENVALKEECSGRLTHLMNVKETNHRLNRNFEDAKEYNEGLANRLSELERLLSEKVRYYEDREVKSNATIQQQTKLIDYLQSKVEELANKKKSFTERLFSHSKKENHPPQTVALNYKDLEVQLQKEKRANKSLLEEIFRLKAEKRVGKGVAQADASFDDVQVKIAFEKLVQSPGKLTRKESGQRMHHNIPHRFEPKICSRSSKCFECSSSLVIGRTMYCCKECGINVHPNCSKTTPRACGLPRALAKHYSDSLEKLQQAKTTGENKTNADDPNVSVEGWVKIPGKNKAWEKAYAKLTADNLTVYEREPTENKDDDDKIVANLDLRPRDGYGRVILEPVESEIGIPVAGSDLPFVIKVEVCPNSTCWPMKCVIMMLLSVPDKEKWYKALQSIFQTDEQKCGETVAVVANDTTYVNCATRLENSYLLGTEDGLFTYHHETLVHIAGPLQVYQITIIPSIKTALMIVDARRVLVSCDLNHLTVLAESAACSKPTLHFTEIDVRKMSGFHSVQASDFGRHRVVCAATAKQIAILGHDGSEFAPLRVLDTAEPTSCAQFTDETLIVGADKFFEIDLRTFAAEEFLDGSDGRLRQAFACHRMGSFPLGIVKVGDDPAEYLLCFNEFTVFVDEFGAATRATELKWAHLPTAMHYVAPYLYVVQFGALKILKISKETCNSETVAVDSWRFELKAPKLLGYDRKGVLLGVGKEVRFVNARKLDEVADLSVETDTTTTTNGNDADVDSDRFSFTSSIVQSLDGLSDADSGMADFSEDCARKKVQFIDV